MENVAWYSYYTCDGYDPAYPDFPGECTAHVENGFTVTHSDYCGCGCSWGSCIASCPSPSPSPTSTCDGTTYSQLCNDNTGVQTCQGKNGTYDSGCTPNCTTCETRYACSGTSCVADATKWPTFASCADANCDPSCTYSDWTWTDGNCCGSGLRGENGTRTKTGGGASCTATTDTRCIKTDSSCASASPSPFVSPPPGCTNTALSVSPNPANVGNTVIYQYNPGEDTWISVSYDSWSGGVSNCRQNGPLGNRQYACTASSGISNATWTHRWTQNSQSCFISTNYSISTPLPVNNSSCGPVTAPDTLTTGQSFSASVQMNNTGSTTWTSGNNYRLGSNDPRDNYNWGNNRESLSAEPVPPSSTGTFNFTATTPSTPGIWDFSWQMVQDGVEWFGPTCGKFINVNAPLTPPPTPSISASPVCTPADTSSMYTIYWTNPSTPVTYVDISTDNFASWYNKAVSGTSTNASGGFNGYRGVSGPLTLQPNTTYYVRLWNGTLGGTATFTTPVSCTCSGYGWMDTPVNGATYTTGTTYTPSGWDTFCSGPNGTNRNRVDPYICDQGTWNCTYIGPTSSSVRQDVVNLPWTCGNLNPNPDGWYFNFTPTSSMIGAKTLRIASINDGNNPPQCVVWQTADINIVSAPPPSPSVTWTINAQPVCTNGLIPTGQTQIFYKMGLDGDWNYGSLGSGVRTQTITTNEYAVWLGLLSSDGSVLNTYGTPPSAISYGTYFNPPTPMAQWNTSALPSGTYTLLFQAPDSLCTPPTIAPWIQTTGGDVHSNSGINTPGGP